MGRVGEKISVSSQRFQRSRACRRPGTSVIVPNSRTLHLFNLFLSLINPRRLHSSICFLTADRQNIVDPRYVWTIFSFSPTFSYSLTTLPLLIFSGLHQSDVDLETECGLPFLLLLSLAAKANLSLLTQRAVSSLFFPIVDFFRSSIFSLASHELFPVLLSKSFSRWKISFCRFRSRITRHVKKTFRPYSFSAHAFLTFLSRVLFSCRSWLLLLTPPPLTRPSLYSCPSSTVFRPAVPTSSLIPPSGLRCSASSCTTPN